MAKRNPVTSPRPSDFPVSFPALPPPLSIPEALPTTPTLSLLTSSRKPQLDSSQKNMGQPPIFFSHGPPSSFPEVLRDGGKNLDVGSFRLYL